MTVLTAPDIILRPVISEKSIDESGRGKYTFAVHHDANKIQIKAAVEELYKKENVTVVAVNVLTTKAKEKRRGTKRGRIVGHTTPWRKAIVTLRERSRGRVFGLKGGATGGGQSQVIPGQMINLHFNGDFHAITSAHNLLAAMIDSHLHQENLLRIDIDNLHWPRTIDMNDRALRHATIGLGGGGDGVVREEPWVIIPASGVIAIVSPAYGRRDLQARRGRCICGSAGGPTRAAARRPRLPRPLLCPATFSPPSPRNSDPDQPRPPLTAGPRRRPLAI